MTDNMPINIMLCEPETFKITYLNKTSENTLASIEEHLPIASKDILGSSIDVFHKNPAHQHAILKDPSNLPFRSKIKLGDQVLDLNVNAIIDSTNHYIGPMLSWSVITSQEILANTVLSMANDVFTSSSEVERTAQSLSEATEQASIQTAAVAKAAEEASCSVQTIASATEEMTASIGEISEHVSRTRSISEDAVTRVGSTIEIVENLNQSSKEIDHIISIINDIAEQTNLLALNATIEAARAGDAGKGFAVVASEVKALANETTIATDTIQNKINAMQRITEDAVSAIAGIQEIITQISESNMTISSAIQQQSMTTQEISKNIQEAAQATADVSTNASSIQSSTKKSGESSHQLLSVAEKLTEKANIMNNQVSSYLEGR